MKKKILILNGQYLPGYKGGGPIQSCANMVESLANQFDFYILTADRDFKSQIPYENIRVNEWNQVGSAKVFYMSPNMQTFKGFKKILNETEFDLLYLNGFFSPIFTIKPLILRMMGQLKKSNIILTPRGDFTGGLENKKLKKYMYIFMSKLIGLYGGLVWHATSKLEEEDIKKKFKSADSFIVPNLPEKYVPRDPIISKKSGELRVVFISRIFPKKNLKFALEILSGITSGNIIFDIFGPMEDKEYWRECETVIKKMPSNVKVVYKGEVPHSKIPYIFEKYHAFFFPTLGENYGHVIVEGMMNNCLLVLSKGVTPWDDYNLPIGTVADLHNKSDFDKIIRDLVDMDNEKFLECIAINRKYVEQILNASSLIENYATKFDSLSKSNNVV